MGGQSLGFGTLFWRSFQKSELARGVWAEWNSGREILGLGGIPSMGLKYAVNVQFTTNLDVITYLCWKAPMATQLSWLYCFMFL